MCIRPATVADIPLIRQLAHEIWHANYPGIISLEQIDFMLGWMYSPAEIESQLQGGVHWELVEKDGAAIGFVSYGLEPDHRVKLHKLYIVNSSQRQGIGRALLDHVMTAAAKLGGSEVWMQVNKKNTKAIAAYKKAGFHVAKEATFDIGHGYIMDDYLMAKPVPFPA
jgi:ribosomal protein S18 acetylase RimI-like enzyme